ncbi:MAG TPA: PilN domain-containing protein [Chroococcidiopsis sp.]
MYSLDVNFLSDRVERPTEAGQVIQGPAQDSSVPLYIGLGVAALLIALTGGLWFFLQRSNASLTQELAELDTRLTELGAKLQEVATINAQVKQIEDQNKALATVFDRIKPWSAILQDIRDRVPDGVQITLVQQSETAAPPPPPPADPAQPPPAVPEPPPAKIEITGQASNFDSVNDFLLTLQRSPFLNAADTRLVSATLIPNPTRIDVAGAPGQQSQLRIQLPDVVEYKLETSLTPRPASELLQDLERTLAIGLPARIQALRDKGVIQQ